MLSMERARFANDVGSCIPSGVEWPNQPTLAFPRVSGPVCRQIFIETEDAPDALSSCLDYNSFPFSIQNVSKPKHVFLDARSLMPSFLSNSTSLELVI